MRAATALTGSIAALVLAFAGTFAVAEDANLGGTWKLTIESPQGKRTPTLMLSQSGTQLSGTYRSQIGEAPLSGKVSGSDFSFDVKVSRQGQEITLAYRGTVSGNDMKGTLSMGKMGAIPFTGTRSTE